MWLPNLLNFATLSKENLGWLSTQHPGNQKIWISDSLSVTWAKSQNLSEPVSSPEKWGRIIPIWLIHTFVKISMCNNML